MSHPASIGAAGNVFAPSQAVECRPPSCCLHLMPIRRRCVALARLLLMLLVPGAAAGLASAVHAAAVNVDVERRGETVVIEASTRLTSSATMAWRVLTDYDRYGDFIPGVISSRVVDRRGTAVTVEQSDELALWLLRMPLRVTYAIREFPPNRVQSRATISALPALESSYVLTPVAFGVRLDYVGRIGPGWLLLGRIQQDALRRGIVRQFTALADEIERRSAAAALPD
jgi:hypothetical protein